MSTVQFLGQEPAEVDALRVLLEQCDHWQIAYCLNNRRKERLFQRILDRLQIRLNAEGKVDWELLWVDGSSSQGFRAAISAGQEGGAGSSEATTRRDREACSVRQHPVGL